MFSSTQFSTLHFVFLLQQQFWECSAGCGCRPPIVSAVELSTDLSELSQIPVRFTSSVLVLMQSHFQQCFLLFPSMRFLKNNVTFFMLSFFWK